MKQYLEGKQAKKRVKSEKGQKTLGKTNRKKIINKAWRIAQKRWNRGCGGLEVTIWDVNEVVKAFPDLVEPVDPKIIAEDVELGKRWLLNERKPTHVWGWWSGLDPQELKEDSNFSKIWDTAITLRALLRSGYPAKSAEVGYGIRWLLENRNNSGGWGRLPSSYAKTHSSLHEVSSPYETSCALLALLEARKIVQKWDICDAVKLLEKHQRESGDWPLEFTHPESKEHGAGDVGATSMVLTALIRSRMGTESHITRGIEWLKDKQNLDGGWGSAPDSPSVTAKTCDALGALLESGHGLEDFCVKRGVYWLQKNQGSQEVNGRGWGSSKVNHDGQIAASNAENTSFVISVLLKAGFSPKIPQIQDALLWLVSSCREDAWQRDTPRVILSLSEYLAK